MKPRPVPKILVALAASALVSCKGGDSDTGERVCAHDPPLTYDNWGKGFMDNFCVGCHSSLYPEELRKGAPVGVDFDTYAGVMTWVERVESRATGAEPTMPPGGGPSAEQIRLLEEWLACAVRPDAEALGYIEGE